MSEIDPSLVIYSKQEDMPEAVKALCAYSGSYSLVKKSFNLGNVTCFLNKCGEKAFFRNEVVENFPNGRVFLPWADSPLVIKVNKKVVAVALPLSFSQDNEVI